MSADLREQLDGIVAPIIQEILSLYQAVDLVAGHVARLYGNHPELADELRQLRDHAGSTPPKNKGGAALISPPPGDTMSARRSDGTDPETCLNAFWHRVEFLDNYAQLAEAYTRSEKGTRSRETVELLANAIGMLKNDYEAMNSRLMEWVTDPCAYDHVPRAEHDREEEVSP